MPSPKERSVLIIGGSGYLGNAVGGCLSERGYKLRVLTRRLTQSFTFGYPTHAYRWDGLVIPPEALKDVDAVINLAGHPVAERRWTPHNRKKILNSRLQSTKALAVALAPMEKKPEVVIQASAIGYYGTQGRSEICDENSPAGDEFLAQVCQAWEKEAALIADQCRLCIARIGLVLGWGGGALSQLWDLYSSGLGAALGSGRQWMNWIHVTDLVAFIENAVESSEYRGTYNLVAPHNVNNSAFHKLLCKSTRSFPALKVPSLILKMVLGERATLVLNGPKVESRALGKQGFQFAFPKIELAMEDLLSERVHVNAHYVKIQQWVPASIDGVWEFITSANNLEKITPPWLSFKVKELSSPTIEENTRILYDLKVHGIPIHWRSKITAWQPKTLFADIQEQGPYAMWFHRHIFKPLAGGVLIEDRVEYTLPIFPFGYLAWPLVQNNLRKIFSYRKQRIAEILSKV